MARGQGRQGSQSVELTQLPNRPLWYEHSGAREALNREEQADVVIVGAGYTGLWTAYYLLKAQPSLNVILLEREAVGFGASGRNGGWASAIFPISLERVAQMYSHAAALHLQAAMNETVNELGRVLDVEGIDAAYAKQGFLSLARSQPQFDRIQASVDASARFGLSDQWRALDAKEAATRIGAERVLGGLYTEHCAIQGDSRYLRFRCRRESEGCANNCVCHSKRLARSLRQVSEDVTDVVEMSGWRTFLQSFARRSEYDFLT